MKKCPTCGVEAAPEARLCSNCGYEYSASGETVIDLNVLFKSEIEPIREKLIEKYQILRFIGKGGFSTVFLLKDKALERPCALKILARELTIDKEIVERFKREARLYASLDHPNIVSVYDFGIQNHVAYIIIKYIDGITLREYIKRNSPMPQREIVSIARDLVSILGYLHDRGIIHRDIKPDNVMIQHGDRKVILTDFGLAKKLDSAHMTSTGKIMGSPNYFSPEQAKGEPVDQRSDIYSLGITIYEMASGFVPFRGDTPYAIILKHINEPIPKPSLTRPDLHPDLQKLILRCTEKDPRRRFQSMQELGTALGRITFREVAAETIVIRKKARAEPGKAGEKSRLRPLLAAAMAAALLLTAGILFIGKGGKGQVAANLTTQKQTPVPGNGQYASLLKEAQDWFARGDAAKAAEKAAVARKITTSKELDDLDLQIRKKLEADRQQRLLEEAKKREEDRRLEEQAQKKSQFDDYMLKARNLLGAGRLDEAQQELQNAKKIEANAETKDLESRILAAANKLKSDREKAKLEETRKAEERRKAEEAKKAAATEKKTGPQKETQVVEGAAKPKPAEAAKIIDLPDALRQEYIKEMGEITVGTISADVGVSGTITLVLRIDETGGVSQESVYDTGVKIDPESRRASILDLVKRRISTIKLAPPTNKAGAPVRVENWRVTFRIGRDRQTLALVRIS